MGGRKAAVSPGTIKSNLLQVDIFREGLTLKNRNDKVWLTVCENLKNAIKPLNLFKMVEQNRHGILSYYLEQKGIANYAGVQKGEKEEEQRKKEKEEKNEDDEEDENLDFCLSDVSIDNRQIFDDVKNDFVFQKCISVKGKQLVFTISVSSDQGFKISPKEKVYKSGKTGKQLQEGWTDVIRKSIWDSQKLPCAYSFDRHFIDDKMCYIKIVGHCTETECKAKLQIVCLEEPKNNSPIVFTVVTADSRHLQT